MTQIINAKRLTASRLDLASHCLWWARADVDLPEELPISYGVAGKEFHEAAAKYLTDPKLDHSTLEFTEDGGRERFDGWTGEWDALKIEPDQVEIAFAYSLKTGKARRLPENWWKKRKRGPMDLVAVVDVVGRRDGKLLVIDHKTGQRRGSAEDSRQLALGALCASLVLGEDDVVAEYHYVGEGGEVSVDSAVLTAFELGALEAELRQFAAEEAAPPRPGTHCSELYCKANELSTCPVTRENTEQMVLPVRLPKGLVNDHDARAWILLLPAVKAAVKKAEAALKNYVGDRSIMLPDGRHYEGKECSRNGYDVKPTTYTEFRIRGRKIKK